MVTRIPVLTTLFRAFLCCSYWSPFTRRPARGKASHSARRVALTWSRFHIIRSSCGEERLLQLANLLLLYSLMQCVKRSVVINPPDSVPIRVRRRLSNLCVLSYLSRSLAMNDSMGPFCMRFPCSIWSSFLLCAPQRLGIALQNCCNTYDLEMLDAKGLALLAFVQLQLQSS